jgi:outer membrane protein OmpA-like peptidoglycan-associated protein
MLCNRTSIALAGALAAAAAGCGSSANRICQPVPGFSSPAGQCVAVAAVEPPPPPEPKPDPEPPPPEPEAEPPPPEPEPEPPPPEPEPAPPPPVVITKERIELDRTIQFETGSAILLTDSRALLDEVVKVLDDHPEIRVIRIEGHTDSQGSTRKNRKLSDRRAKAVRAYLAEHGIAKKRLLTKGFGEGEHVADNDTEEGRFQNRRVDLRIIKRDKPKADAQGESPATNP